jgi:ubiquinone biosynthesis O-methyltransferase
VSLNWLLSLPFLLQGLAMAFDEFYFHRQRGLGKWEIIGHPLDTISVLACFLFVLNAPYSPANLFIFIGLSAFSSLLITKDEFVHAQLCKGNEHWLHSILFILHPLSFLSTAIIWQQGLDLRPVALVSFGVAAFLVYQILFWFPKLASLKPPVVDNSIYETYGDRWYTAYDDPIALLRAESKVKSPWVIEQIRTHFRGKKETAVLDVGCGAGFLSNELGAAGFLVTGVDVSASSLDVAADHDRTGTVKYLCADAYHLPFPDRSFEVVTAMDFLEHIEDPKTVIQEFSRVLKPGGIFIFHTFNRNPLAYLVVIKLVE